MPHVSIAVVDTLKHPGLDALVNASRVVVFDDGVGSRWSSARVVRPSKGRVAIDREHGVAIVAATGARDSDIRVALAHVPDPIVLLVLDKTPSSGVARAAKERSAHVVIVGPGGLVQVEATNEVGRLSVEVRRLAGAEDPKA